MAARFLPDNTVLCSGGVLLDTGAFIGPMAEAFFSNFRVKKVFFGAGGVTAQDGFTDPSPLYSHLKQVMYANAGQCVLLLDSSKLGVRSLVHVMPLLTAKILVTDAEADPHVVAELRGLGLDVRIAE
jgi:DeoR/GlpR family transcriptional regulator of sugar metabolism